MKYVPISEAAGRAVSLDLMIASQYRTVLVVDDHDFILRTSEAILKSLGIETVLVARSGLEARAMLSQGHVIDAIICDLNMPEGDGLEFLRWLSAQERTVPVILMSGEDSVVLDAAQRITNARKLNILGAVEKPLSIDGIRYLFSMPPLRDCDAGPRRFVSIGVDDIQTGLSQGWFEVWFQPQLGAGDGAVHGFEALVRMKHPRHGLLLPDNFVWMAEENGLIDALSEEVISQSLKQLVRLRSHGHDLSIAVNLSPLTLSSAEFPDRLLSMCARHEVNCSDLVLELTESSLAKNPTMLLEAMTRLRMMGFELSLDDFGVGFSTLHHLKTLPFHELKLDRFFVSDCLECDRSRSILSASVDLASGLGMRTVAEGVTAKGQLELLAQLGCDLVQGYLFAAPLPPGNVVPWLQSQRLRGPADA